MTDLILIKLGRMYMCGRNRPIIGFYVRIRQPNCCPMLTHKPIYLSTRWSTARLNNDHPLPSSTVR